LPIVQSGDVNLTAQSVPQVLVQVVPPQVQLITGVPTARAGFVGTSSYGPVGVATRLGSYSEYQRAYGPVMARPKDLGTIVATCLEQGATDIVAVRVTDGTDTAATVTVPTDGITFTARYSGSLGNNIKVSIGAGSKASTWRATISFPQAGYLNEVFDNITGSGNAFWVALAAAINTGQYGVRTASEIVIATAGAGTTAPSVATYTLTGGADGVSGVTDTTLVGSDTVPRSGMYALRGSGASIVALAECTTTSTWPSQIAYGRTEGAYMLLQGAAGQTVSAAISDKATAGSDDVTAKVLYGDWVYWSDATNGLPDRLVSPQGFVAGRYASLSPEQSGLNKKILGIVSTQRTRLNRPYSDADLTALGQAGIDVISNPVPGGNYFGLRFGRNSSSNPSTRTDAHTRLTNYIAATFDRGMGIYIGRLNTDSLRRQCKVTLDSFLGSMRDLEMIEDFNTQVNEQNNPPNRRALGFLQADAKVRYLGVIETLVINLEGGATVNITRQALAAAV
jgi:hypothetical protein